MYTTEKMIEGVAECLAEGLETGTATLELVESVANAMARAKGHRFDRERFVADVYGTADQLAHERAAQTTVIVVAATGDGSEALRAIQGVATVKGATVAEATEVNRKLVEDLTLDPGEDGDFDDVDADLYA